MVVKIASHITSEYAYPKKLLTLKAMLIIGMSLVNTKLPLHKIVINIINIKNSKIQLVIKHALPICFLLRYELDFDMIKIFVKMFIETYKML